MPRTTLLTGESVKVDDSLITYTASDHGEIVLNVQCAEHIRVVHVKRNGRERVINRTTTAVAVQKIVDSKP